MNTIIPWLEHLNVLVPPRNIALVGAGSGKGIWAQWLAHHARKSRVTLIEAEPQQYSTLQRTLDSLSERAQHCEIRNTVVSAQQGTVSFFVANSQQESGLLEPQTLLSLWPNLQTEEVRELSAITLDALFSDPNEYVESPMGEAHWLIIDCLPAGDLLRASSKLDLVEVVVARVLLGEMHAMPGGTSLEEVAEFLQEKGMMQIAVESTRHPGIGYALFVRDARSTLHALVQKHHNESEKLRLNEKEQAKLLQALQAQTEQLTQAKATAEKQSQERAEQLELLKKASDQQAKAAAEKLSQERALQMEQLGKARAEQDKLAQECQAQIEQLTQDKAGVEKQAQERFLKLEHLSKARDEYVKLEQEREVQIANLIRAKASSEKQLNELEQRLKEAIEALDKQTSLAVERKSELDKLTEIASAQTMEYSLEIKKIKEKNEKEKNDYQVEIEYLNNKFKNVSLRFLNAKNEIRKRNFFIHDKKLLENKEIICEEIFENLIDVDDDLLILDNDLCGNKIEAVDIELGNKAMKFFHRPDSVGDSGVIKQIFIEKQYEYDWLFQGKKVREIYEFSKKNKTKPLIIDAGANIGASALWFNHRFPESSIICIEPERNNCEILRKNCSGKDIYLFEGALSNEAKVAFLNDPGEGDWGYRVDTNGDYPVACIGMSNLLDFFQKEKYTPLILKVDVEGSENLIFEDPESWIEKIPLVIVELHDWMLPQKNTSRNIMRAFSQYDFEIITRGENIFFFNKKLIYKN